MDYKKIYNRDYFSGKTSLFYKLGYGKLSKYSFDSLFRPLESYLKNMGESKALDVGCAYGMMLERFPAHFEKYGIDISDHAVEEARKRLPEGKFAVGGAEDKFPFPEYFFDIIVCNNVLEHLERPERALENIFSVLKKGGLLYVTIPNLNFVRKKYSRFHDEREHHVPMYSRQDMLELLAKTGFSVEKHWTFIGFTHFFFLKFRSNAGTSSAFICRK